MSRKFQCKAVPIKWIEEQGRRFDCGPYLSGAMEARELLRQLPVRKDHLQDLTEGGISGIVNAGRITRLWVDDNLHGIPFLSSTDILQADLSNVSYIAKSVALYNSQLLIKDGWTLISRSGAIGRMAYARSDMNGMACTEDVLRVIPDKNKINPGYIYAYLCTRFGLPIVISGTYGSIITHLEPHHIAGLPVPRLGAIEGQAHDLIVSAASQRVQATELMRSAVLGVCAKLEMHIPEAQNDYQRPSVAVQSSFLLIKRMDSYYYSKENLAARKTFDLAGAKYGCANIGEVAEAWIPNIFKRQYVDDPAYGYPYYTGKEIYELSPSTDQYLRKDVAVDNRLLLSKGMILIQDSGQISGLIGRPVMVSKHLNGSACTNNMVRINTPSLVDNGYLFAVLSTAYGIRLLKREASGSSIPHLDEGRIKNLSVPWPNEDIRKSIGEKVVEAMQLRDSAIDAENEARSLVEHAIEEAAR